MQKQVKGLKILECAKRLMQREIFDLNIAQSYEEISSFLQLSMNQMRV